jgi:hypothetical protein
MSKRYSISFSKGEQDLLDFFEKNGKSKIAKVALKFYIDNKDKVINEATINLLKAISMNNNTSKQELSPTNNKLSTLKR